MQKTKSYEKQRDMPYARHARSDWRENGKKKKEKKENVKRAGNGARRDSNETG